jgi:ZIP family zinc transporter
MAEAAFWGLVAGSSLLVGAGLTFTLHPGHRAIGLLMGFGSGTLISAVSYELVGDAFNASDGSIAVAAGLAVGALAFFAGDWLIDRRGGEDRKRSRASHDADHHQAIVLGTILDGIPESIVLGIGLIGGGGGSIAVIAAIFMSNLPEASAATNGLERGGMPRSRLIALWLAITALTVASTLAGFALFDNASKETIAFTQAFAGGALLTMLADAMMPQAFEEGGPAAGLLTVLGFAVAFGLTQMS